MDDTTDRTPSTPSAGPATADPSTPVDRPPATAHDPATHHPAAHHPATHRPAAHDPVPPYTGTVPNTGTVPPSAGSGQLPAAPPAGRYDRWSAKLERPHEGRVLGGVCAGMGEAWRVDPLALRIAFLAATLLLFPAGAVLYLACCILMPAADDE